MPHRVETYARRKFRRDENIFRVCEKFIARFILWKIKKQKFLRSAFRFSCEKLRTLQSTCERTLGRSDCVVQTVDAETSARSIRAHFHSLFSPSTRRFFCLGRNKLNATSSNKLILSSQCVCQTFIIHLRSNAKTLRSIFKKISTSKSREKRREGTDTFLLHNPPEKFARQLNT